MTTKTDHLDATTKSAVLLEALPYIQRFRDAIFVVKYGGAFMDDETRAFVKAEAVSVWLKADLEVLVARTAGRTHRPLLNRGNPREILGQLIDTRYPVYAEADIAVESLHGQTHEAMAARIIDGLRAEGRAFAKEAP